MPSWENNFLESVISFHHMDPGNWTQILGLGDKQLPPLFCRTNTL